MNPVIKNIIAVIVGLIVGSVVNMGIIMIGGVLIPPPNGADVSSMEGLRETMHLFEPKHFIMPFLAHALGTLAGAFIAAKIAATRKMLMAIIIGLFFLAGGIYSAVLLQGPTWFHLVDLVIAYIPMALLGWKLAGVEK
ncbi:MAG TPA: hypothetical protein VLO29_08280 [Salegentibacter sp.]|nr:hypothetical protein [Salegentibacter sp.]